MGLFDGLTNLIENAVASHPGGLSGLMSQAFNNFGGLQGIVDQLNQAGLGTKVNSWLGKGDNIPLTTDEISSVLGSSQLQELATRLGVPMDQVAGILAQHLPAAVDQASPNGTITTNG